MIEIFYKTRSVLRRLDETENIFHDAFEKNLLRNVTGTFMRGTATAELLSDANRVAISKEQLDKLEKLQKRTESPSPNKVALSKEHLQSDQIKLIISH